jgi:hypothetical protein
VLSSATIRLTESGLRSAPAVSVSISTTTGSAPKAAWVSCHSVTASSPVGSREPMAVSTSSRVSPTVAAAASTVTSPAASRARTRPGRSLSSDPRAPGAPSR